MSKTNAAIGTAQPEPAKFGGAPTECRGEDPTGDRRSALKTAGAVTLSGVAIALLGGCETLARDEKEKPDDVATLNYALGLEHEAIGIYTLAAGTGFLSRPVLRKALEFQGHHKGHRDALVATITKLGGRPVAPKTLDDYKQKIAGFPLTNQTDVLRLALRLEKIAADEYLKAIPKFGDSALGGVAGRIAADEVLHWTVYAQALAQPLPKAALSFGG